MFGFMSCCLHACGVIESSHKVNHKPRKGGVFFAEITAPRICLASFRGSGINGFIGCAVHSIYRA